MNQRVIDLLAEAVELLRQQQQQEQQQPDATPADPQPRIRKVARMLDIVAHLPERFTQIENGFAIIVYGGWRVKVALPEALREAELTDLRGALFVFSVDLMERPDGRRFTSIRGRPIDQSEARNRLILRPGMVRPLAEELVRLPGISWCLSGTEYVLEEMAVPGD